MRALAGLAGRSVCAGCGRRGAVLCRACRAALGRPEERPAPPGIRRLLCPYRFENAARALVLDLKARGRRDAVTPLAAALVAEARRWGLDAVALTWVPCSAPDRRRRGFDHAEVLARAVAERLGLPCRRLLERTGPVADQVGLSARERRVNLAGAFWARPAPGPVGLVDDVITTGATAESCASALCAGGATSIELLVACSADR